MATATKSSRSTAAKPAKRPRCLHCTSLLAPHVKLVRGQPQPTGRFGRYGDGCFCGQVCGYQYGVAQAKVAAKARAKAQKG